MLSIDELEKRWLYYKIKSYIPHAIIALIIFLIALVVFMVTDSKPDKSSITDTPIKKIEKVELKSTPDTSYTKQNKMNPTDDSPDKNSKQNSSKTTIVEKPRDENRESENEKVVISPSFDFLKEIEKEAKKPTPKKKESQKKADTKKKSETEPAVKEEKKNVIINIGKENTQKEIQDVIRRFKKTNSPVLSLFVAKKYYEAGDYTMAYNYALITNKIDNEIETSWLIFAKSLVKLNQKDKAIKTLKEYVNHSHSSRARTLLDEIISGKMK